MSTTPSSTTALNERRRLAVKLRLEGRKLKEISDLVELSSPTIITAHKKFLTGGWEAVDVKPPGRPTGDRATPKTVTENLQLLARQIPAEPAPWNLSLLAEKAAEQGTKASIRTAGKMVDDWSLAGANLYKLCKTEGRHIDWLNTIYREISSDAKKRNASIYWAALNTTSKAQKYVYAHTTRGKYHWLAGEYSTDVERIIDFFDRLATTPDNHSATKFAQSNLTIIWQGIDPLKNPQLSDWLMQSPHIEFFQHPDHSATIARDTESLKPANTEQTGATDNNKPTAGTTVPAVKESIHKSLDSSKSHKSTRKLNPMSLTHLQRLEAESIHIMREVIAEADKPVMLYSIGKDSAVMLHLAQKAFYPARLPFPLLHVDTGWKFQAMYEHRDKLVKDLGVQLITHTNPEGIERGVNPFTHGSSLHTDIMKTHGLRQALDMHGFDVAFGGARRDEEASRAKERVLSFRTEQHRWDPKNQRPELWNLYNTKLKKGESIRAFPLSNWTELDVWQYIHQQNIPLVPLYFAAERPVVLRDGTWIMVDDDRMPMNEGEVPIMKRVRFRTLGCYPLTGAVESNASTVPDVISEMLLSTQSERQGRMIDHDSAASMEKKKQEGYF